MTQAAHMQPSLGTRIVGRLVRDVKSMFGLESYLRNADRYVLEQVIFPYFLCREQYRHILFVGCHWYTKGYNGYFEGTKNYLTIDVDRARRNTAPGSISSTGCKILRDIFTPVRST